ncbi:type II toxin-antitoxin system RelE/ParE family toxin [Mesorhizobium sp. VK25A]|uniref:Type II toxin-antitoxin system RelE/ParE family toxin n=1 Tax=Mesorhizobium vachelliae TaxID=3072309 RepID=A0ABU4ZWW8_9HYPH|nr:MULTISPECIES: type II toxin-antitoxin system RelE/ParE family toxin [unclassified Mesorhizobium]MDX8529909.1 type II toxin-antitoxin system RelE/ParE family toxin [Mesorhizobium sp. VK25D]MDX8544307.1 type II toxin-antitoxin system RelE/ParE family toxin [Mesorhizobium sp. VK25A]
MPERIAGMTRQAEKRFLKGIAYIAERNPPAAEKIVRKMRELRERLADFPNIGVRGDIPGTRRVVLRPFVLTVRKGRNGVEIAAVRHAKQGDAYAPSEALDEERVEEELPSEPKP